MSYLPVRSLSTRPRMHTATRITSMLESAAEAWKYPSTALMPVRSQTCCSALNLSICRSTSPADTVFVFVLVITTWLSWSIFSSSASSPPPLSSTSYSHSYSFSSWSLSQNYGADQETNRIQLRPIEETIQRSCGVSLTLPTTSDRMRSFCEGRPQSSTEIKSYQASTSVYMLF